MLDRLLSHIGEATYQLNLLKGERMYKDGFSDMAYTYLNDANLYRSLTGEAASHYAELKEKKAFDEIMASSDATKVRNYLNSLAFSNPHYNDVSNHLALLMGSDLTAWSSEYSMEEALSFAKDKSTKETVKRYISNAKSQHRAYERQRKARARKAWWKKNFKIGIDADFETNIDSESGSEMFYSVGLLGRFGNYSNRFSFVIGAKYRWFRVMPKYRSSYSDSNYSNYGYNNYNYSNNYYSNNDYYDNGKTEWQSYGGAIGIPVSFRYNIAEVSYTGRLYIGLGAEVGVAMFEESSKKDCLDKNYVFISPQFGIIWPNFELSCYWKSYVMGPFTKTISKKYSEFGSTSLIGMQMAIYF